MNPESEAAVVLASYYAPQCNLDHFESSKFLGLKGKEAKDDVIEILSLDSATISTKAPQKSEFETAISPDVNKRLNSNFPAFFQVQTKVPLDSNNVAGDIINFKQNGCFLPA